MSIIQLRYIMEIADSGSTGLAAEKLHITQSSLLRAKKKLEQEIGTKLFVKKNKIVEPTEECKRLLVDAAMFFEKYDEFVNRYTKKNTAGVTAE